MIAKMDCRIGRGKREEEEGGRRRGKWEIMREGHLFAWKLGDDHCSPHNDANMGLYTGLLW
jgi:hypothetical protein